MVKQLVPLKSVDDVMRFAKYSLKILPFVISMSDKYNSTIYLLHVIEDISKWGGVYIPHIPLDMYQEEAMEAAEKFMDKVCNQNMQACPNIQRRILSGDPAAEILKTIESEVIDLVIIGTHGYKGLEHAVFGSVAEKVVKKSPVPVMVVNPYTLK